MGKRGPWARSLYSLLRCAAVHPAENLPHVMGVFPIYLFHRRSSCKSIMSDLEENKPFTLPLRKLLPHGERDSQKFFILDPVTD